MDDSVIQALMSKFGMGEEVAQNQPPMDMQGMRRGVSKGSTNASERASMRQMMNDPEELAEGSDSQISDKLWKTIQEIDPKDGEKFYQMKGQEAMDALGLGKNASDIAEFWDTLTPEDRYYVIRALDMNVGGPGDIEDIKNDTMREKGEEEGESETEKSIIDQMMQDEAARRAR